MSQFEFDRTVADQLAIQLYGHVLIASDPQSLSLKIFHFRQGDVGAKKYLLQIFNDLEITDLPESNDIEKPIIQGGVFKEREWSSVTPAIPDQHKRGFVNWCVSRLDKQPRRSACRNMSGGNQIAERSEIPL